MKTLKNAFRKLGQSILIIAGSIALMHLIKYLDYESAFLRDIIPSMMALISIVMLCLGIWRMGDAILDPNGTKW